MDVEARNSDWEVATACDLSLAPVFADTDKVLEIDTRAIEQTLDTLPTGLSDSRQAVTFTATNINDSRFYNPFRSKAAGIAWHDKETDVAHALVGVAGFSDGDGMGARIEREYRSYAGKLLSNGVPGLGATLYEYKPEPIWRETEEIQRTAVHELQHTIDFHDTPLAEQEQAMKLTAARKAKATLLGAAVLAPISVVTSLSIAQPNRLLSLSAGALTFAFGRRQAVRVIKRIFSDAYAASAFEDRAFATQDIVEDLPQIISVKSV